MKKGIQAGVESRRNITGKIKWRQHEITLVSAIAAITLAAYIWRFYHGSLRQMEAPFVSNHVHFSVFRNMLLPDLGLYLVLYLCFLWINLHIIPRLRFQGETAGSLAPAPGRFSKISERLLPKKIANRFLWIAAQVILLILVLGTIFSVVTYFKHEWQFHYPGFSIFFNKNNPRSQMNIYTGYFAAAMIIILYGLYCGAREMIIQTISKSKQKEYHTLVCNKVTGFVVQMVCVPVFLNSFGLVDDRQFFVSYFLIVPALFAMFISNVYWLFPMKGDGPFLSQRIVTRLLSTSFIYSIPLIGFVHESAAVAFIYSWALQLFVVTPVTWWYYQSNRQKILQLKGVETKLVQSQAHLQFLRSQINPHFLFNTLNTLYGTALEENAERTAGGIQRLGDMMRFMLHENHLDYIQMSQEIDYLKNYIALQKLRTQSSPDIVIEDNIGEQNCTHPIAPMLLIPLVENAFKHGISLNERSWIQINLECTPSEIRFEVRNSIHPKDNRDPEKEISGIGFKNVEERLRLMYPGRFRLSAKSSDKEFIVQLTIQPHTV